MLRVETRGQRPDYLLLGLMAVLLVIGLQAVYSASFVLGLTEYNSASYFLLRQALWALVGAALMVIGMRVDYRRWRGWSKWLMLATLGMLVALFLPGLGITRHGATRWLNLGPLPPIQPSEFAKLFLIIYVSAWLSTRGEKLRQMSSGFIPFLIMVSLVAGLVILQPDLGTAVVIMITMAALFFLAGADLKHIFLLVAGGLLAGFFLIFAASYRAARWESFINPWEDPAGKGFHIIQLLIALGSGGLFGLGPGASRQKFFYVPGSHTDGIFAIIGEEVGLLGGLLVIALFAALIYRGFKIAMNAPDEFGALLAVGITLWLAFQTLINLGGITRSIPLTGIPLPFISYGGSSLASAMAGVGILLNISRHRGLRERRGGR